MTIAKSNYRRLAKLKTRRNLWLDVYFYLGLVAGAVLTMIGLAGVRNGQTASLM